MPDGSEEHLNELYSWMEELNRDDKFWTAEKIEQSNRNLERLSGLWTVTVREFGVPQEFVHAFAESEETVRLTVEMLLGMGVSEERITVYKPGELYSL